MSPLPAAASELFHYLMPRGQPSSTTAPAKSFKGPSIQDEQREKQLSPLEAVGQILKRSVYTRVSPVTENSDEAKPRTKAHDKSPPSFKVDPFVNHLNPFSIFDKIKLGLGTIFLLPFRALLVVLALLTAWFVAKLGMYGLDQAAVESTTISRKGWRRKLLNWYRYFGHAIFYAAGFRIKIIGKQATRQEAPILVGAPHSSFLEAVIMIMCGASPVSRMESRDAIIISSCQLFSQTIFVDRRTPETRQKAKEDIKTRSLSPDQELPQLFLCPEGTNTNRRVLIQFKVGAFISGVPVQPIAIRYPGHDRIDAVTWTFKQSHTYLYSIWCLFSTPVNHLEVEFLPVYHPNEEEKQNPELYAKNVQLIMAEALGIEATDITYKKYYAEYCAMHNLGTPKHTTERCTDGNGKTERDDQQLNNLLPNQESQACIGSHRSENGVYDSQEVKKDR